jgi:PAS domain-containing protein
MARHSDVDKAFVEQFAARLRFLRKLEQLTQAQLAEHAGVSVEHVNKLERGCSSPSFSVICALARALDTDPANLFLFAPSLPETSPTIGRANALPETSSINWIRYITGMGAWEMDPSTGETKWSASLYRLLGYEPGEVAPSQRLFQGRHVSASTGEEEPCDSSEDCVGMPGSRCEYTFVRKDGQVRLALADCDVELDETDQPRRVSGTILDITELKRLEGYLVSSRSKLEERVRERTEHLNIVVRKLGEEVQYRKRVEEALRLAERERTSVLSGMSDYVLLFKKPDRRVTWANRKAEESLGAESKSLIGRMCVDVWGNCGGHCSYCPVEATFEQGRPHRVEKVLQDGSTWSLRAFPCFHESGELFGVVLAGEDVTGCKGDDYGDNHGG